MSKILELRNKRAELWESARNFLNERQDERGILSAEDTAAYEKMENDIVEMGKAIERLERARAIEDEMNRPTTEPILSDPGAAGVQGRASREYASAFWNMLRRGATPEARNALQVGADSEGGYLAPDEFERRLIKALEEQNVMRRLCTVITTESGDRKIPVLASGGNAAWTAEEAAYNESDMSFDQVVIGAHKLTRVMKVSEELLNDSAIDLEGIISEDFARCFGEKEEEAFLVGDGSNKPTGLLDASGGMTGGITAASATAVTFDEIFDLYYALKSPYRGRAVWLMNDMSVKLLRKLKDQNNQYIWQPSVQAGQPDMIMGRPLYTSPFMPQATSGNKAFVFGDLSNYWIADRQARNFRRLNELYATTGQVGFLSMERVDGKLVLPEAVKAITMKSGS